MLDRKLALVTLLGGATYLGFALRIKAAPLGDPWGPKVLPVFVGCALVILAFVLLWQSRSASHDRRPVWGGGLPLLAVMGVTAVYALLFDALGYVVATVVCLFGLLLLYSPGRLFRGAAIAAAFSVGAYFVFHILLGAYLPAGILG